MEYTASSQKADCPSNTPLHPSSSPLISFRLNYPTILAPALWNRNRQSLDTNTTPFLITSVMEGSCVGKECGWWLGIIQLLRQEGTCWDGVTLGGKDV